MSFKSLLIHQCEIAAPTTTRDGGELVVSYGATTTVNCRFVAQTEHWSAEAGSRLVKREHKLMLEANTTIDRRYRVTNITVKYNGEVVDAGPFLVNEVLIMGNRLRTHHKEVVMERSE